MLTETIINGIFTLAGASIGVLYTWLNNRKDRNAQNVIKLVAQVTSYWQLEKLYCKAISDLTNQKERTVMQDYRDKVEDMEYERPTLTEREARKML